MNSMQLIMRRESALPSCPLSGFQWLAIVASHFSPLQPHHSCFLFLCEECTLDNPGVCPGGDGKGGSYSGLCIFVTPFSKVNELDEEKMKTEEALHDFLPVSVVRSMKVQIEPNLVWANQTWSNLTKVWVTTRRTRTFNWFDSSDLTQPNQIKPNQIKCEQRFRRGRTRPPWWPSLLTVSQSSTARSLPLTSSSQTARQMRWAPQTTLLTQVSWETCQDGINSLIPRFWTSSTSSMSCLTPTQGNIGWHLISNRR